jgi:hypothetical protein
MKTWQKRPREQAAFAILYIFVKKIKNTDNFVLLLFSLLQNSITFDTIFMKFKLKINNETTIDDIRAELENLKLANVNEIPLNHLLKITEFLGAKRIPATGSSIRFQHSILKDCPPYKGFFQVHKIHKGGNMDLIRKNDFKAYMYPVLVLIIDLLKKE